VRLGICQLAEARNDEHVDSSLTFSAVLLAGGHSVRMGGDKALLPFEGRELWKRQWALLDELDVTQKYLSARAEQTWVPAGIEVVHDDIADAGPLAGIAAAMARATTTHLLVLAVDLPLLQTAWLEALREDCAVGIGAVGCRDGFYEPLAAIYPCSLRQAAERASQSDERSLRRFIAQAGSAMKSCEITEAQAGLFANWNEPGDA
jgi:molybdopterin-guanine dinucleotide biosynthesis protein A